MLLFRDDSPEREGDTLVTKDSEDPSVRPKSTSGSKGKSLPHGRSIKHSPVLQLRSAGCETESSMCAASAWVPSSPLVEPAEEESEEKNGEKNDLSHIQYCATISSLLGRPLRCISMDYTEEAAT